MGNMEVSPKPCSLEDRPNLEPLLSKMEVPMPMIPWKLCTPFSGSLCGLRWMHNLCLHFRVYGPPPFVSWLVDATVFKYLTWITRIFF